MRFVGSTDLAIVIPVHNPGAHLWRSIDVLREMSFPEAMIVVVDDGSTDGTSGRLAETHDLIVITADGNLWWTGAVEVGARAAIARGAQIVLLWNDDNVSAAANTVTQLVKSVRSHDGCASPVVLDALASGSPTIAQAGGATSWRSGGIRLRRVGERFVEQGESEVCEWLAGQALAFSSLLFNDLGGFDARRFPQYRGDTDFTLRAHRRGATCRVLHSCWVANDSFRTGFDFRGRVSVLAFFRGLFSLRSNYEIRSTVRFYIRHCPFPLIVWSLPLFYTKYVYACAKTWIFDR